VNSIGSSTIGALQSAILANTYTLNGLLVVVPEALESVPDILIWKFYNRTQRKKNKKILQAVTTRWGTQSVHGFSNCCVTPTRQAVQHGSESNGGYQCLPFLLWIQAAGVVSFRLLDFVL
jgi:hypothetical protein